MLAEFLFTDDQRSKAVAIAAMVGIFVNHLLPERSLRPCFVFVANAEGAGKSLLVTIGVLPCLGIAPVGSKANDEDEIRKVITTAVRETSAVIFFDNLKGHLSSPALEAFLSATVWKDRRLGSNESIIGENLATVVITGNGLTVSPDMRRRSLFLELRLEVERAEDREFKRILDVKTLLEMRESLRRVCYALPVSSSSPNDGKPSVLSGGSSRRWLVFGEIKASAAASMTQAVFHSWSLYFTRFTVTGWTKLFGLCAGSTAQRRYLRLGRDRRDRRTKRFGCNRNEGSRPAGCNAWFVR